MIAVIRIRGNVKLKKEIDETFKRLKMYNKYNCVFLDEKDLVIMGMLNKIKEYVIFGKVDEKSMKKVIEKRGQKNPKGEYKGYCRLHPPIGGFKKSTKLHPPKGILGENKEIDKYLEKML